MRIFAGVPRGGGVKQGYGGENKLYSSFQSNQSINNQF